MERGGGWTRNFTGVEPRHRQPTSSAALQWRFCETGRRRKRKKQSSAKMDTVFAVQLCAGGGGGGDSWRPEFRERSEFSPSLLSSPAASSQRPGQVAEVHGSAQAGVRLQQGHDDRHGRLVVAGAAGAGVVHDVYAQVGVVAWMRTSH